MKVFLSRDSRQFIRFQALTTVDNPGTKKSKKVDERQEFLPSPRWANNHLAVSKLTERSPKQPCNSINVISSYNCGRYFVAFTEVQWRMQELERRLRKMPFVLAKTARLPISFESRIVLAISVKASAKEQISQSRKC